MVLVGETDSLLGTGWVNSCTVVSSVIVGAPVDSYMVPTKNRSAVLWAVEGYSEVKTGATSIVACETVLFTLVSTGCRETFFTDC